MFISKEIADAISRREDAAHRARMRFTGTGA